MKRDLQPIPFQMTLHPKISSLLQVATAYAKCVIHGLKVQFYFGKHCRDQEEKGEIDNN